MPRRRIKHNQSTGVTAPPYDPNNETDTRTRNAAMHWELLRRSPEFKGVARRWITDREFRIAHSASQHYHNHEVHFPRCALDWMISADERVDLSRVQLEAGRWFFDSRFNFGPIVKEFIRHPLDVNRHTIPDAVNVQPLPDAPPAVRVEHTWPDTPEIFRAQFRLAVSLIVEPEVVTQMVLEAANTLQWVAARLNKNDAPEKLAQLITPMYRFGVHLKNLADFHTVFAMPKLRCAPREFERHLEPLREHHRNNGLIDSRFVRHKSWLGTSTQWRYYLLAEQKGYDPESTVQMAALARLYSEDLKRGLHAGTVRRDTKRHGFMGTNVPSKVIANRRSTVRGFITDLQKWIANIYPPARWMAFMSPPTPKPSGEISTPS